MLIEDDSREQADIRYAETFCNEGYEEVTKEQQDKELVEEDFIAEVAFSSYREIEDGEDLEQGEPIPSEVADAPLANAFEDGLAWATEEIIQVTPNPFRELLWARYEGEEVVEIRLCPKGHQPAYEDQAERETPFHRIFRDNPEPKAQAGWKRSEFGEDACGVVLMKKPASTT